MNNSNIIRLKKDFIGRGEVKGFRFTRVLIGCNVCIYRVENEDEVHYEVFKVVLHTVPFSNQVYERYPTANAFGVWAWTYKEFRAACSKSVELIYGKVDL